MKGVTPICGPWFSDGSFERSVFYTPFDDSTEGWAQAREFIDWYCHEARCVLGIRSGFNEANKLARSQWDMFLTWYAIQKLLGE